MPPESSIAYFEHAQDILATTVALIHSGQPCALVTSLAIEGGAAREVGSLAVVAQSGIMTGYLSNGCIDRDIVLHGLNAIRNGRSNTFATALARHIWISSCPAAVHLSLSLTLRLNWRF